MEIELDDINTFCASMKNYIGSIEDAIERIKAGSDVDKGYMLDKIEAMKQYVQRSL